MSVIVQLYKSNETMRSISKKMKVSIGAVQNAIKIFRETGGFQHRKCPGRSYKTTKSEDMAMVRQFLLNRRLTASEIRAEVNKNRDKPISIATVKRRLQKAGLIGRIALRKPLLRPANRKKRLEWAKKRSIMIWGCFGNNQVGDLIIIEGILRKEGYKKILEENVLPSGRRLIGRGFVFQEDNDPKHSSNLCRNFIKEKENRRVWPPQSPDLNPIELLWDELNRGVRKQAPTSKTYLWELL